MDVSILNIKSELVAKYSAAMLHHLYKDPVILK